LILAGKSHIFANHNTTKTSPVPGTSMLLTFPNLAKEDGWEQQGGIHIKWN